MAEVFCQHSLVVTVASAEEESQVRDKIGGNTADFLEQTGILSFANTRMFWTYEPPPDASEVEISLVAATKIAIMEELLSARSPTYIERCRELRVQSLSRLAALQLNSRLGDSYILPIDYGHRWIIDINKDRVYDEFESTRHDRHFRVDPPTNKWNYYLDLFNKSNDAKYSRALSLTVDGISVSDEHCNWGDIIDFREKMDNRLFLYRMKKKVFEISDMSNVDIYLEIESEKQRFNKQFSQVNRENALKIVKSILTFSADIIPNLVKLKWGETLGGAVDIVEHAFSEWMECCSLKVVSCTISTV